MEIGISMFGSVPYNEKERTYGSTQQRLREMIEQIRLADEVGLDVFGIGEHHRHDFIVSSPEIVLAAAATITTHIKLTSAVTVLSSADPVRTYQNFSTADLISNGRVEITLGRGSFTESFPLFGYNLEDYDELFSEKLDLFLKINKYTTIDWRGNFRSPLKNAEVLPRAVNNHLDVWIAVGGSPESVIRAAQLGIPMIFAIIGGEPKQFKPFFDLYKEEYTNAGHDPLKMRLATHSPGIISDEGDAFIERIYPSYASRMNKAGKERGWAPFTRVQFDAGRLKEGAYFFGSADEIADKILYHRELFGLTRWMMHCDTGGPEHKDIMKSIELLGTKVIPIIRKATVVNNS